MKKKIFAAIVTVHSLSTVCCRSCLFFFLHIRYFPKKKNITEENFKKFETFYSVYYTTLKKMTTIVFFIFTCLSKKKSVLLPLAYLVYKVEQRRQINPNPWQIVDNAEPDRWPDRWPDKLLTTLSQTDGQTNYWQRWARQMARQMARSSLFPNTIFCSKTDLKKQHYKPGNL